MTELPSYSNSRAILIGTANYSDTSYPPLPAVANSLQGVEDILADPYLGGWPTERITQWKDPTDGRRLLQSLRRMAADTQDVLLLYFAGHGTIVRRGQLCLVLADTDAEDPDITGLEYERVREALLDSPAHTKIVILDCCYSGRAIEALAGSGGVADSTDTRGVYTLTASDHTAHVVKLERQADSYTSFTGELLNLLRTGIPDGPEHLSLNLIYLHLRQRLQARGLPAPNQRGTDTSDRHIFARNAARQQYRRMEVVGVRVEIPSNQPILLLKEQHGERYLPVWVGAVEATPIATILQGPESPAPGPADSSPPLTHNLFSTVLNTLDIHMSAATITTLVEGVFNAVITLNGIEIRSRVSDAIMLALLTKAPILASELVLGEAGIVIPDAP